MKKLILFMVGLFVMNSGIAQSLEEIIEQNIAARGGMDRIRSIETLGMDCISAREGMQIPMSITIAHGVGFRMDMELMGMDNFLVTNEQGSFSYFPVRGQKSVEKIEGIGVDYSKFDLHGDLIDYESKGITLELKGEEQIGDKHYYIINSKKGDSYRKQIYIEIGTFLKYKELTTLEVNGETKTFETVYEDYKSIDGYIFPMKTRSSQSGEVIVRKYFVNKAIESNIFEVQF